jgi:hypothetical protein
MWTILQLVSCFRDPVDPEAADRSQQAQGAPPLVLTTTDIEVSPGTIGLKVRGFPSTNHKIMMGTPGGPTTFQGVSWSMANPQLLHLEMSDSNGWVFEDKATPASVLGSTTYRLQASALGPGGVAFKSNVVERTSVPNADPSPTYNILLILADDMGVDRMSIYEVEGDPDADYLATTPNLDTLADTGLIFDNAWSLPICGAARAALQTGRFPRRTGWGHNADIEFLTDTPGTDTEFDDGFFTLAELVRFSPRSATVATTLVGKWQLTSPRSASSGGVDDYAEAVRAHGWDWYQGTVIGIHHWFGESTDPDRPTEAELDLLGYDNYFMFNNDGTYPDATPPMTYATTKQADWQCCCCSARAPGSARSPALPRTT